MNAIPNINYDHRPRRARTTIAHTLLCTIAVTILSAISAQGTTIYSGGSVGTNGTIYGWGVTDVYYPGMIHTAYVSTTLRSPKGRTISSGLRSQNDSVRADISLPWDPSDLGWYPVTSDHQYYCFTARVLFPLGGSAGGTNAPSVVLSLRTGVPGVVATDNHARNEYNFQLGTYGLGTFRCTGYNQNCPMWGNGVEIVGTVNPTSFQGLITLKRQILMEKVYQGCTEKPALERPPNSPDTSDPALRDDNPQSDSSGGRVYDLDFPGIGTAYNDQPGTIMRKRVNFTQWAELQNGMIVSNSSLFWYSRVSAYKPCAGCADQLNTDYVSRGDNSAAAYTGWAQPKVTCDLW